MAPELNLLVIRVSDLEMSRRWYECLGFAFVQEQHRKGPSHYACDANGWVFELYPASARNPASATMRIGFAVADVAATIAPLPRDSVVQAPTDERPSALLVDPDGIKVALEQAPS